MSQKDVTPSVPVGSLVPIAGLNGHVASHTAKLFLERGYRVRGTVRDLARAAWLTEKLFKHEAASGALEVVSVPNLAAPTAYDKAIKGVSIVISVALLLPEGPDFDAFIDRSTSSVRLLLEAAEKESSVREFVSTSSISAASSMLPGLNETIGRDTWNEIALQMHAANAPDGPPRIATTYWMCKVQAEKEAWNFVSERKPHFSVNTVLPGMILGEPLNESHIARSKGLVPSGKVTSFFTEGNADARIPFQTYFVDVQDVALLHLAAALDADVKSERIQAWGLFKNWNDVLGTMRGLYPDHKQIPGDVPDKPLEATITTDMRLPLQLLKKWGGQDGYRSLEQMIKDMIDPLVKK